MPLIHHSDRGFQYCANEYQNYYAKNEIQPSMLKPIQTNEQSKITMKNYKTKNSTKNIFNAV